MIDWTWSSPAQLLRSPENWLSLLPRSKLFKPGEPRSMKEREPDQLGERNQGKTDKSKTQAVTNLLSITQTLGLAGSVARWYYACTKLLDLIPRNSLCSKL